MIFGLLALLVQANTALSPIELELGTTLPAGYEYVVAKTERIPAACMRLDSGDCLEDRIVLERGYLVGPPDTPWQPLLATLDADLALAGWRLLQNTGAPPERTEYSRTIVIDDQNCFQRISLGNYDLPMLGLTVTRYPCEPAQDPGGLPSAPSPRSSTIEALLGISANARLREAPADCTPGNACPDSVRVVTLDAETFRYEVEPALHAAGWEPLMIVDSVEGDAMMQTYLRVHLRSPDGHVVCADRLDYRLVASEPDARLTVQFANCQE